MPTSNRSILNVFHTNRLPATRLHHFIHARLNYFFQLGKLQLERLHPNFAADIFRRFQILAEAAHRFWPSGNSRLRLGQGGWLLIRRQIGKVQRKWLRSSGVCSLGCRGDVRARSLRGGGAAAAAAARELIHRRVIILGAAACGGRPGGAAPRAAPATPINTRRTTRVATAPAPPHHSAAAPPPPRVIGGDFFGGARCGVRGRRATTAPGPRMVN